MDVRFSIRVLRKSPGFMIVAVLTLALAIGANAVIFGMLNGLILRRLDVPQSESLYGIERSDEDNPVQSYPDYLDLRDLNRSFDSLAAYRITEAGLDTGGNPSRVFLFEVSGLPRRITHTAVSSTYLHKSEYLTLGVDGKTTAFRHSKGAAFSL